MDTACSSALTAVHAACEHIRAGRGDIALAGGVTVMITAGGFIGFSQASMLSPEGRCKAFDASADGFVRGEGAGMLLLKRLSRAIADGDPIHGVIIGTALNQDGHTNGISLPSAEAQARLVREACADAGITPSQIGFVEAHGTGTAVGDPIEAHALAAALCEDRSEEAPLLIGSVKTNLGHLETAAGVAGLVKALLVLKHRRIPASLHFETPNPNIDFAALKLRVPTALEPFPAKGGARMVGVNSFGFGGANAHVLLTEAPLRSHPEHSGAQSNRAWPLVLSARSEEALRVSALRLSAWLDERSNANGNSPILPDLAYTLGARRNHHPYRLTVVAQSIREAIQELNGYASSQQSPGVRMAFAPRPTQPTRVAFVMSGQGPQWWAMGRELIRHEPVFRQTIERCDAAMRPWARFSLIEELGRSEEDSQMHRTEIAQPAIFAMQVALAKLWKSWGVQPAAVVGHSVGEVAAACVAGVLSLEEAARVIVLRARFMDDCARGEGTMLAIGLDEEAAKALIARHDRTVTIAAFNGPRSLTIAGPQLSLEAMADELELDGVFARFVQVDHPFHHPLMRPASESLEEALADLAPKTESVPFFSTVTGRKCAGRECDAVHWARGIRQPVQFALAVNALMDEGIDVWLEISAQPALVHSIQQCLAGRAEKAPVISSARREREHESVLETAMELHRCGVVLNFAKMTPSRRLLSLPTYAWDKSRWWHESGDWHEGRLGSGGRGMLDARLPRATPTWTARLDSRHMSFLKDHKVENLVVFPASAFVEMVLEAGVQLFNGRPFVVEDFQIRKPLILPEPASGLHLELSYDPEERTFSIQSKFDYGATWSMHVVGSMRGERTDAGFASSTWKRKRAAGTEPVELDEFYRHMSDMGLPYGEEFRPIRELAAGHGESAGRVSLSDATMRRVSEYALHPVLLDGALQIFSAGAATVEDHKARLRLPVRFAKILFLRSPGASSFIQAAVQQCNDECVEGRLEMYDGAGKPCVLVDGFRAVSVSGARRSGSAGSNRNVLYHLAWERTTPLSRPPSQEPLRLDRLRLVAQDALDQVIATRGRAKLEEAMAAGDELAAALLALGLREMATVAGAHGRFTAGSLRVTETMRPVFERLLASLTKRGWLENDGTGHRPTPSLAKAADSAQEILRSFISDHSGHLSEALLCAANCAELGPILRGEKDAVQVLFAGNSAELLDQFYGEGLYTSHWLAAIAATVQEAARHLPEGRPLRILEIGAGTGGLTSHVLPLIERDLHSYIFSDVSAAFFSGAMQKLAGFPAVEYKIFDLEKPGPEQGFELGAFDFIIGTNVLHAVSDLRSTLRHLHELLAPGGNLVFMDVAIPQLWTETVFGLMSGWWRFTDRDLRPFHPLLGRAQWEVLLGEMGFAETASLPGLLGPEGEGQIGLLARKAWHDSVAAGSRSPEKQMESAVDKSWVIFADASGLGDQLVSQLQAEGTRCRVARRGDHFSLDGRDAFTLRAEAPEDWKRLLRDWVDDTPPERLVFLWSLDTPRPEVEGDAELMGTDALLHLIQAIQDIQSAAKLRIDLVTRGAQPPGRTKQPMAVAQAPLLGLLRVILNEYPNFSGRAIDLPPEASASDLSLLWSELRCEDREREIAFRGEARYVQRLARGRSMQEEWLDSTAPRATRVPRTRASRHVTLPALCPARLRGPGGIDRGQSGWHELSRRSEGARTLSWRSTGCSNLWGRSSGRSKGGRQRSESRRTGRPGVWPRPVRARFPIRWLGEATCDAFLAGYRLNRRQRLPVVFMTAWHALQNVARDPEGGSSPGARRGGRRRNGRDPDCALSGGKSHRHRGQPSQTCAARDLRGQTCD